MTQLQAGDMAPDFKSTTQDGAALTLADLKGQRTILYFYPKDNTRGARSKPRACATAGQNSPAWDSGSSA